jgi:lycopene cyclase domain-containing protein
MSYLEFHLVFNLPVLLLLAFLARRRFTFEHAKWIGVVLVIVLFFAIPWDSWAVRRKLWDFSESQILMRIGVLPLEEYLFFVIATLQASLLTILFLPCEQAAP